jgi:hypothetical protein
MNPAASIFERAKGTYFPASDETGLGESSRSIRETRCKRLAGCAVIYPRIETRPTAEYQ